MQIVFLNYSLVFNVKINLLVTSTAYCELYADLVAACLWQIAMHAAVCDLCKWPNGCNMQPECTAWDMQQALPVICHTHGVPYDCAGDVP